MTMLRITQYVDSTQPVGLKVHPLLVTWKKRVVKATVVIMKLTLP